jgi:hypothetical protein
VTIVRVNAQGDQNGSGATTLTVTKPTGLANTHVLVASCIVNASGASITLTGGTAWTQLGGTVESQGVGTDTTALFYKVVTNAAGEPASYTFNFGTSRKAAAGVVAYSGCDTANPIADWQFSVYGYFNYTDQALSPQGGGTYNWFLEAPFTTNFVVGFIGTNLATSYTPATPLNELFDISSSGGGNANTKVTFAGYDSGMNALVYTYPQNDPSYPGARAISASTGSHGAIYAAAADNSRGSVAVSVNLREANSAIDGGAASFDVTTSISQIVHGAFDYRGSVVSQYIRQDAQPNAVPAWIIDNLFVGGGGLLADPINADQPKVWSFRSTPDLSAWNDDIGTPVSVQATYGGYATKVLRLNSNGHFAFTYNIGRFSSSSFGCPTLNIGYGKVDTTTGAITVLASSQTTNGACYMYDVRLFWMYDSKYIVAMWHDFDNNGTDELRLHYREINPTTGASIGAATTTGGNGYKPYWICDIADQNFFLLAQGDSDIQLRVVSASGSTFNFYTAYTLTGVAASGYQIFLLPIDATHVYLIYKNTSLQWVYRIVTLTGTIAITDWGTETPIDLPSTPSEAIRISSTRYGFLLPPGANASIRVYDRDTGTNALSAYGGAVGPDYLNRADFHVSAIDNTHVVMGWSETTGVAVADTTGYVPMAQILTITSGNAYSDSKSDPLGLTDSLSVSFTAGTGGSPFNPIGACTAGPGSISSTVPGYTPVDLGSYVTPVQIGSVNNLTMARTPAGRIILGWDDGNVYYVAVLDDWEDAFRDNSVPYYQRRRVFYKNNLKSASIWVDGGELFLAVAWQTTGGEGRSECYIADNVESPSVWTLRGVIDTQAYSGGGVQDIYSTGPVTVTRTGRWVLPVAGWIAYGGSAPSDASALFTSDDRGVTWTVRVEHRNAPLQSGTTGPQATTVAQNPVTGRLHWCHYWGPLNNEARIWISDNDGASWSVINGNAAVAWNFFTDDGDSKFYAARNDGSGWVAYEVTDPSTNAGFINTGVYLIHSNLGDHQFQFIKLGCVTAVIDKRRVAIAAQGSMGRGKALTGPSSQRVHVMIKPRSGL